MATALILSQYRGLDGNIECRHGKTPMRNGHLHTVRRVESVSDVMTMLEQGKVDVVVVDRRFPGAERLYRTIATAAGANGVKLHYTDANDITTKAFVRQIRGELDAAANLHTVTNASSLAHDYSAFGLGARDVVGPHLVMRQLEGFMARYGGTINALVPHL